METWRLFRSKMKPILLRHNDQEEKAKLEGKITEGMKSLITSNNDNFKQMC